MSDLFVPGPISGKNYRVRIKGDTPTADERQQIDAFVRQREAEFAGQYQERYGENLLPSTGFGAQIGELFRGIPRGAVGLGETAALGAATLLPERFEAPVREGIRSLGTSARDRFAVPIGREGMVGGTLGEGLGSTLPFFALAPLGPLGIGAGAALGGAAGAGEASERARAGEATQEERNLAALGGLGVGLSEIAVPVALRGLFGSLLRSGVPETTIRARLARIGTAATAEGAQEAAAEFLQNAIEQGVYNPEKDLQDGLLPAAGVGAGVGAIIQALIELGTRSRGPVAPPTAPPAPPPAAPPASPPPAGIDPATLQTQLQLPLPDPVAPLRPRFVEGQDQGELFAPRTEREPAPTTEAETAPPPSGPRGPGGTQPGSARRGPPPPSDDFDVDATVAALRTADGNYVTAMRALGITYPELQQRVRHLESIGRVSFDRTAGKMLFAETETAAQPDTDAKSEVAQVMAGMVGSFAEKGREANANKLLRNDPTLQNIANEKILRTLRKDPFYNLVENPDGTASIVGVKVNEASPWVGQAPTTQETQDAQATPSGPVGADPAADRAGPEGGIAEPRAGDGTVDADTAGAQPPVGDAVGEPVLGARAPDAPEGAQPTALTPRPPFDPDRFAESVRDASERGYMAPPDTLLEQSDIDARVAMARGRTDPETPALAPEVNLTPGQVTGAGPQVIPSPVLREPPTSSEAATAAIEPVPTTPEAMQRVLDEIGIGERTGVGRAVRQAARGETELTPEGFLQALGNAKFKKPEVRRKRDEWLSGARERLRNAPADPAVDTVVAQIEELRAASTVRAKIGDWFAANASPALKTGELITPPTDRDSVPLSAKDMRAILGLLESSRAFPKSKELSPEKAAARYFGRASDPGVALMIMAHDAAHGRVAMRPAAEKKAAGIKPVDIIPQTFTKESILGGKRLPVNEFEAADVALLENLGWGTGIAAERWVMANLSPDGIAKFISARDGRSRADSPGYIVVSYSNRAERRDAAKGLRSDGRTIDQMTDKELEARKEALAADQAATEEKARQFKGISPDRWAQLSPQLRQEHVADYFDLLDSSRSDPVTRLPDAPVGPIAQERVRRAVPRREKTPAQQMIEEIEALQEQMQGPQELDFGSFAGQTTWPSDAHPRVGALIAAGRFGDAVRLLAATAPNADIRALAAKLASRVANVRSQIVPAETMNRIRAAMSPETPTLGVETPSGVYVHPMSPEAIAAMRREGHEDAASIVEEFGGQILFNADTPLAPELVMHEASHAAGDAILTNKSHPLTRQLDKLRTELLKFMPATHYGLSNVREFFAEGMTNPAFRQQLSQATAEGRPRSAWTQFKDIVRNWLRGVMGRQPIKPDTPLTALDRALDAIMASNPNEMGMADIADVSFAPGKAAEYINNAFKNARVPTKADLIVTRKMMQNLRIPTEWKGTVLRYAVPLDYVADLAAPYLPSARQAHELVGQRQQALREAVRKVVKTTEDTAKVFAKYAKSSPELIEKISDTAYLSSLWQVDPRKDPSAYDGYSFQYNVLDKDGNILRREESKRYKTEAERNNALRAYNANLTPEQREGRIALARKAFDQNAETTANHKRVRDTYLSLPPDLQGELSRMLEIQPAVAKGWTEAIRERIKSYVPDNRSVQNKIFNNIYNKILAGQMLDPYLGFERRGDYWLSYSAVDPLSITVDPVTGQPDYSNAQIEQFKHSFETVAERDSAIEALSALPPANQVNNIHPYENGTSGYSRQEIPLDFVSNVLSAIDDSGSLATLIDPKSGAAKDLREEIINLVLDSVPESSFINSFKKRQGIRGFRGDVTPLAERKSPGDVLKNMRDTATRLARKTVDLQYGAKFATVRKELNEQNKNFQEKNPLNLSPKELSRLRAEVGQYASVLTDYTRAPFFVRNRASRIAGAGTYMLTLGFNVSTAVVTMSQIPLFVYPVLAGKYSDARALGAIGAAHRILASSSGERSFEKIGIDGKVEIGSEKVPFWQHSTEYSTKPYMQPLVEWARKNGVFSRSLMQDELMGMQPNMWEKIAAATGILQHQAERYSRETALNAAYLLELQTQTGNENMSIGNFVKGLDDGTITFTPEQAKVAADSAVNVSEKSNGPLYAEAGPLGSQGNLTSLIYMFKRHPLAMMNLLYQTASRGLGSTDPADRKIAQRQFARMFGMLGIFSGALGLPLMQQVGWLYDLFAEDDEPDFKTVVRMALGEAGAFGAIDFATGMRVSERMSMSSAIYRPGFNTQDSPPLFQIMEGLGGPVLGMGLKYFSGKQFEDFKEGDIGRGIEGSMPSAVANFFKAVRFANEGALTRRGDLIDDIGPFHIWAQALGFMPASYEQQLAMNSLGTRVNNAIATEKSRIMQKIHRARAERDTAQLRQLEEERRRFDARNPNNRITEEALENSRRASERVTTNTSNGLYVPPANRQRVQAYLDAYGPSSIWAQ
jgi:hypothetical protein